MKILKSGKCLKCGECCRRIPMKWKKWQFKWFAKHPKCRKKDIKFWLFLLKHFHRIRRPKGISRWSYYYRCDLLDKRANLCTIHDSPERPSFCLNYPFNHKGEPFNIDQVIYKGCGFMPKRLREKR